MRKYKLCKKTRIFKCDRKKKFLRKSNGSFLAAAFSAAASALARSFAAF